MLTVSRHGVDLRFDTTGFAETPYVYRPLLNDAVYEEPFLAHVRSLDRVGVYVDVGAHLGTHTLWFAALCPATHVHAFEPVGRFADVVRRNVAANGLTGKVTVHQTGLSDSPGQATNLLSPEHQLGFTAEPAAAREDFPVARLDRIRLGGPVAVIKLDVEGMEAAVLRGAGRILSRHRPVVYAEAHDAEAVADITQALAPYGYRHTGRVFNASPTYEFVAPARRRGDRLRPLWRRLPAGLRRTLRQAVNRTVGRAVGRGRRAG
jgi:FkbM family methyltransferase